MSVSQGAAEQTTSAAVEEKAKLQRHFGRFDMFFFLICTLVGLDTIGAVAANGAQGFTWLMFLGLVFFIPYAFLTAELGAAFTEEGGPYIWTKLALGRFVSGVNAIIYWISNPIWLGGTLTITAVSVFNEFFHNLGNGEYIFGLLFIWFSVWAAILSFGVGKWIPTLGAWGRMIVLGFFSITVVIYAIKHGVHGVARRQLQADLHGVHRARAGPVLQLRGLRVAQRRGRRDEEPAAGCAVHRDPLGDRIDPALRRADPDDPAGAAAEPGHEPGRLHRLDQDRVHRLRRPRRRNARPRPPSPGPARCWAISRRSRSSGP